MKLKSATKPLKTAWIDLQLRRLYLWSVSDPGNQEYFIARDSLLDLHLASISLPEHTDVKDDWQRGQRRFGLATTGLVVIPLLALLGIFFSAKAIWQLLN